MINSKFISAVFLFTITSAWCQDGWLLPGMSPDSVGSRVKEEEPCDTPTCVDPCPEAAPPRYCPANLTRCSSGCACMLYCKYPKYVCFQIRDCISRRRYLKRPTPPSPTFDIDMM